MYHQDICPYCHGQNFVLARQRPDGRLVYSEIARRTGASSATISRVNRCYAYGAGGYTAVVPRLRGGEQKEG